MASSFLFLALHHALPRHNSLKLPSEVDWVLIYFGSSYRILSWITAPSYSSSFCIRICREMLTWKRNTALHYHLGGVRILVKSHSTLKKSENPRLILLWDILLAYNWSLNNMGLKCAGPLQRLVFISKYYSTQWFGGYGIPGCEGTQIFRHGGHLN